jgi:hypothetical protein
MEQKAVIKFRVKLKKTATEMFEMSKVSMAKNIYLEQANLNA